jgi:hypothetical protein
MVNSLSGGSGQGFQYLPPMGVGQPGAIEHGVQELTFRDDLDATRSGMANFIPSAQYPDGYLGTIQSRRGDRLLDNLKTQLNQRSYQRGVHKGEKVDPRDYFWPPELQPNSGLQRQMGAVPQPDGSWSSPRYAPMGTVGEQMQASHATELPMTPNGRARPAPSAYEVAGQVSASLKSLAPNWK